MCVPTAGDSQRGVGAAGEGERRCTGPGARPPSEWGQEHDVSPRTGVALYRVSAAQPCRAAGSASQPGKHPCCLPALETCSSRERNPPAAPCTVFAAPLPFGRCSGTVVVEAILALFYLRVFHTLHVCPLPVVTTIYNVAALIYQRCDGSPVSHSNKQRCYGNKYAYYFSSFEVLPHPHPLLRPYTGNTRSPRARFAGRPREPKLCLFPPPSLLTLATGCFSTGLLSPALVSLTLLWTHIVLYRLRV